MGIIFVAGIGIAVLIEMLLLSKKKKSVSDRILTLWMFLIVVHLFLFYMYFTGEIYKFPFLLGTELPLPLLHGVFLYLYVSSLTNQRSDNSIYMLFHFVPVIVMYLYLITFFFLPNEQKALVYRNQGAGFESFNSIRHYAILFVGVFYVTWSTILLKKHQNAIQDQFSDLEKVNLRWLRMLTYGLGSIWILLILFQDDTLVFMGVVGFIFLIGFFGVRQSSIFVELPPKTVEAGGEQKEKYQKSGLGEEASKELHSAVIRLMTEQKLYRSSDLSINDLSSKLGVHPNYLSQVINQREKKHFYDFVNTYRIEEFKEMITMQKNQQFTLLSMAFDCGFSSKTSFNRYFKRVTGQTPSEYVNSLPKSAK
jgi:AraC-like DNA-binding protein